MRARARACRPSRIPSQNRSESAFPARDSDLFPGPLRQLGLKSSRFRFGRPALPALRQARGLIVAVSSVAGYTPLIARTGYAASKHALHGFFESLRTELAPDGIDVMMVCPSFIATGIDRNALGPHGGAATHAQVVVGRRLQPDEVADRVFRGAERSRRLLLIGRTARTAWWVSRLAPSLYERIMARKLQDEMTP